jgi:hypothetical protein
MKIAWGHIKTLPYYGQKEEVDQGNLLDVAGGERSGRRR